MKSLAIPSKPHVIVLGGLLAVTLLLVSAPAQASGGSTCTRASIAEPFVLPDGTEHQAGTLKLCVERRHSPVAHMHEAYVDGMAVGLHIGRTSKSEGPASTGAYVMFVRGMDGRLLLVGYARPGTENLEVHTLRSTAYVKVNGERADRMPENIIRIAGLAR